MSRFGRTLALTLGAVLVGPLLVAPVAADQPAPVGGPVIVLDDAGQQPAVVVDRSGNTTVVWATHWCRGPVLAVTRPAGGAWGAPERIGRGTSPQVAVDRRGDVTVVFETNPPDRTTGVSAVRRPAGADWGAPVRLSVDGPAVDYDCNDDEGAFGAHRADLAVGPRGATVVVWQWGSYDRDRPFRIEAVYRPADGRWRSPVALTRANWSEDPVAGVDRAGNATVAYAPGAGEEDIVARRRVVGVGWRPPVRLTGDGWDFDVVVAPVGDATVVFARYAAGLNRIHAVRRPATGVWGAPRRISPEDAYIWGADVVVDASGTVSVVWDRRSGRIDLVRRPRDDGWSAPVLVAAAGDNGTPRVATNVVGDLAVLWQDDSAGLTARLLGHLAGWTPPFSVDGTPGYLPAYHPAVFPDGGMVAVWQSFDDVLFARLVPDR